MSKILNIPNLNICYPTKRDSIPLNPKIILSGMLNGKNMMSKAHFNNFATICLVVDGNVNFVIDGTDVLVKRGNILLINPKEKYCFGSNDDNFSAIYIGVSNLSLKGFGQNCIRDDNKQYLLRAEDNIITMQRTLFKINDEMKNAPLYCDTFVKSLASIAIITILRIGGYNEKYGVKQTPLQLAKNYIDENYEKPITLQDICDNVFISKYYLSRKFKEQVGVSPIKYIVAKRMVKAKELLANPDLMIKDIAISIGYVDDMYFSKVFKDTQGISPSQFRQNLGQNNN